MYHILTTARIPEAMSDFYCGAHRDNLDYFARFYWVTLGEYANSTSWVTKRNSACTLCVSAIDPLDLLASVDL